MALDLLAPLIARNPATGCELARLPATPPDAVEGVFERAREAQSQWSRESWPSRSRFLERWWAQVAGDAEGWATMIAQEVGKPRGEAMAEVVATLDALKWTARNAGDVLADQHLRRGWQRWAMMPKGDLRWRPFGVVGAIGTWNYPLFLNAPVIAQAVAAGNAVVWKPSELATLAGRKLQEGLEAAGLPEGLVAAVFGGPEVGRALIEAGPDKGVFTGGVEHGRTVLGELGRRGIPAVAELSGCDAAVILPDAPVEPTARALTWAAFVACGQTCIAVKRAIVVGDAAPWARSLADRARALRLGDPEGPEVDVGPMISAPARDRFDGFIRSAVDAGARVLAGGRPLPGPGWFYEPTVLQADGPAPETALAGCFGPVVLVRGVADADAAILAANASPFGLGASVWGRDRRAARAVADRLDAGMVSINDAVTPSAHAHAPFGGTKSSGFGRVHGPLGLREFAQPQTLHSRPPGGFRPHLFPYSPRFDRMLSFYRKLFHPQPRRQPAPSKLTMDFSKFIK